jgi:hypothetical protein
MLRSSACITRATRQIQTQLKTKFARCEAALVEDGDDSRSQRFWSFVPDADF